LNAQKSENALILSWPTNAPGFLLQSAGDLISSWTDFTNSPGIVGTNFALTNAVSVGSKFYRLKK